MEFKNTGETKKIRIGDVNDYGWLTVRSGQTVELPKKLGELHNFEEVKTKVVSKPVLRKPSRRKPKKRK